MSDYMQDMPQVAAPFPYVSVSGSKTLLNGTHAYVMAFGKVSDGEESWANTDKRSPTAPIIKNYCQFWMHEVDNEKNKFVRWLWTGKNDPIYELGLDTKNQDLDRLKEIYAEKASRFPIAQPEEEFILPVFKVVKKGKTYDMDKAEAQLLIVRKNMLGDIIAAAKNFADQDDASIYGRVLVIEKNLQDPDPKKKYKFSIPFAPPIDLSRFEGDDGEIAAMREKAKADINKVYQEANGGNYDPANVRGYLITHFGGTWEQLVAKYSVKANAAVNLGSIEEIEL